MNGAVAMVGRVESADAGSVVIVADGTAFRLRWASSVLATVGSVCVGALVLVVARDGVALRLEVVALGPESGAVLPVPDDMPALDVRPGVCPRCSEAGWIVEAPAAIRGADGPADVLVLPLPGCRP